MSNELSENRKAAIELAQSFGWHVSRSGKTWEFTRPETGAISDIFHIAHKSLSVEDLLYKLAGYEPDLRTAIRAETRKAMKRWLEDRRPIQAQRFMDAGNL